MQTTLRYREPVNSILQAAVYEDKSSFTNVAENANLAYTRQNTILLDCNDTAQHYEHMDSITRFADQIQVQGNPTFITILKDNYYMSTIKVTTNDLIRLNIVFKSDYITTKDYVFSLNMASELNNALVLYITRILLSLVRRDKISDLNNIAETAMDGIYLVSHTHKN